MNSQDIGLEIVEALKQYTDDVVEAIGEEAQKIALEGAAELRQTSPRAVHNDKHYADGWTKRKQGNSAVVYNRLKPGLTHLLENGYLMRNGKRSKKQVHIEPVEEKMIEEFEERSVQIVKKGGRL